MEYFVFKNKKNDKFIGIDTASGGYPYETEHLPSAKIWTSKTAAREYANGLDSGDWGLFPVLVWDTEVK